MIDDITTGLCVVFGCGTLVVYATIEALEFIRDWCDAYNERRMAEDEHRWKAYFRNGGEL